MPDIELTVLQNKPLFKNRITGYAIGIPILLAAMLSLYSIAALYQSFLSSNIVLKWEDWTFSGDRTPIFLKDMLVVIRKIGINKDIINIYSMAKDRSLAIILYSYYFLVTLIFRTLINKNEYQKSYRIEKVFIIVAAYSILFQLSYQRNGFSNIIKISSFFLLPREIRSLWEWSVIIEDYCSLLLFPWILKVFFGLKNKVAILSISCCLWLLCHYPISSYFGLAWIVTIVCNYIVFVYVYEQTGCIFIVSLFHVLTNNIIRCNGILRNMPMLTIAIILAAHFHFRKSFYT